MICSRTRIVYRYMTSGGDTFYVAFEKIMIYVF